MAGLLRFVPSAFRCIVRSAWFCLIVPVGPGVWLHAESARVASTLPATTENLLIYDPPQTIAHLGSFDLHESSGLAASRIRADVLWSHNDSGDRPRLFAFNTSGEHVGTCAIAGAQAVDWEDMASFTLDGVPYLLIGDVGDNRGNRPVCQLYLVLEQDPTVAVWEVKQTVSFRFETGPTDCESIAFDPVTREVLLVGKNWELGCLAFSLAWPEQPSTEVVVARPIARLGLAGATSMDISPDGSRAIVLTYGNAFEYQRGETESWAEALGRPGRQIGMPARRQGEAICYGRDGATLFLTSESRSSPLYRVAVRDPRDEVLEQP